MMKSKIKNTISLLLCIIFTVFLNTRSFADNNTIMEKVEKATVLVYLDSVLITQNGVFPVRSMGTGFLASEDGYIVTNAHIVNQNNIIGLIKILVENKTEYNAQVVRIDNDYDLSIIKIMGDVKFQHFLQFATDKDIVDGHNACFVGYPLVPDFQKHGIGISASISDGLIKKKKQLTYISKTEMDIIEISSDANKGNSGGPLFIPENGKVIGVITKRLSADSTGISFAVPIKYVRALYFESLNLVQTDQSESNKNAEINDLIDIIVYELEENQSLVERNAVIFSQNIELLAERKILTIMPLYLDDNAWKRAKIENIAILNRLRKDIRDLIQSCYHKVADYNEQLNQRKSDSEGINRAMSNYLEMCLANEKLLLSKGLQLIEDINKALKNIKSYRNEL